MTFNKLLIHASALPYSVKLLPLELKKMGVQQLSLILLVCEQSKEGMMMAKKFVMISGGAVSAKHPTIELEDLNPALIDSLGRESDIVRDQCLSLLTEEGGPNPSRQATISPR